MRKSRFTEAQTGHVLQQAEAGVPLEALLRKYGVSSATFYVWKKK
jgi:putative transposase